MTINDDNNVNIYILIVQSKKISVKEQKYAHFVFTTHLLLHLELRLTE